MTRRLPPDDDACRRLAASRHRREIAAARARERRRLRVILAVPAAVGALVLAVCVTSGDPPGVEALRDVIGVALCVPFLATFDVLGEAPTYRIGHRR